MNTKDSHRSNGFIKFISYLQIIGIILVVLGHSLHEYPDGHNGMTTLVYRAVYSFHMPLFLFVSGLLMIYSTNISYTSRYTPRQFLIKKIQRLLVPFFVLTVITFVPRTMMSSMADDTMTLSWRNFLMALIHPDYMPIPFFWFIQVCFIMLVATYTLLYYARRSNATQKITICIYTLILFILAFIPVTLPRIFSISYLREYGLYFASGSLYGLFSSDIDRLVPWAKPTFFWCSLFGWVITFILSGNPIPIPVCAITGIIMCISLAKILEQREWTFLDHLSGANFMIFLISWYINVSTQQILSHFLTLPWWVHTSLSLICGISVPWLGYKYLEKHQHSRWCKITSYLLGQSFKKK